MKNSVQKQRGYNLGTPEMKPYKRHMKPYQNDAVLKHNNNKFT